MNLNVNDNHLNSLIKNVVADTLDENIIHLKFIGGGSNGKVYSVITEKNKRFAVKAFRIKGAMQKESNQMILLSKHTKTQMPEVLFLYEDNETALMGMTFIEGKNVLNPYFVLKNKSKKEKFANAVVDTMLEWHSVMVDKFGDMENPSYENWRDYYITEKQKPFLEGLSKLADNGKFSKKNLALLKQATEIYNNLPDESEKPVLIHGDLNIMNIMADPKSLDLMGIIDPSGSIYANREYDLFQLRNMWGDTFGLYDTYKNKSTLTEFTDFRVAYYGAMNEASCRLSGGLIMPLWEVLWNRKLKKEIRKLKNK